MNDLARRVQRTYLTLLLGNTLAASFIWGLNTLFLLDAGLSNLEAFAANAFFTAGMTVFEVPTGVVADTWGRRTSYLLGTLTLAGSTLLCYLLWVAEAPFWQWAVVSMLLGLGFTFFSGAVEAWLVDALHHAGYDGGLEAVLGRGQMIGGIAMLGGSVAGRVIAQATSLGVPFLLRVGVLLVMLALLVVWGLVFAASTPIRQAYLNDMIPSQQRATVLSFDSLLGSSGGVVVQPVLGKAADATSYGTAFAFGALFQLLAVPFLFRSRREGAAADRAVSLSELTEPAGITTP